MLSNLLTRVFATKTPIPHEETSVAVRLERLPAEVPEGNMICVFRRGTLLAACRQRPPQRVAEDEVCWLVPTVDLPVQASVERGGKVVALEATVRFESDITLGELFGQRTALLAEDLEALVTSELSGLLDLLGQKDPEDLLHLDDQSRERLRAKLSVLLQARGLRCTGLDKFRLPPVVEIPPEPEPPAAPAPAPAPLPKPVEEPEIAVGPLEPAGWAREDIVVDASVFTEPATPPAPVPPSAPAASVPAAPAPSPPPRDDAQQELVRAVGRVKTDEDWELLMGELEEAGFEVGEESAAELDELGEKLVDQEITAEETAARIRQMAEEAGRRAGVHRPDLRRWQGLALRLRVAEPVAQSRAAAPAPPAPAGPAAELQPRQRPWTWWFIRRRAIDERLRGFLEQTTEETQKALEEHRAGLRDLRQAVRVRELDERLKFVADLLATVPPLVPSIRKLRPDRQRVKELVGSVESAVTAAEMLQAQVRALLAAAPGSVDWQEALGQARSAADALAEHLRERREVR